MIKIKYKQKGFSVIELLVVLSILSGLMILVAVILMDFYTKSNRQFTALSNVDQARLVTSRFVNEIRNANFGVDGSYPLNTLDNFQIIFYSQKNGETNTKRIRYYLVGNTLYKGVVVPSGNPLAYNLATESTSIVQNDVVNGSSPIFTYYDGNYNGSTNPLVQPVNVNSVKFIKINLTVLTQIQQNSNTTFSISSGANIRNLKDNLGT